MKIKLILFKGKKTLFTLRFEWNKKVKLSTVQCGGTHSYQHVFKCFTLVRDTVLSLANTCMLASVNFYQHPSLLYTSTTLENADEDCKERRNE